MKYTILAVLLAASFTVSAGNNNSNGGCQGNCSGGGEQNSYNQGGTANAGAAAGAVAGAAAGAISGSYSGGGDASATGGNAVANGGRSDASANLIGSGNSTNKNDSTAIAAGGHGGSALSVSEGGKGGSAVAAGGAGGFGGQGGEAGADARSTNDNKSAAQGNITTVTTKVERNAPPVYLGNVTATMSCAGGFQAGSSSQGGSGALGFSWISADCRSVVAADKFREIGMVDTACRILKTTKGFQRAAKRDASLKDVSCELAK